MLNVHTFLHFDGKAEEAFKFYQSVFGGEITVLVRYGEYPVEGVEVPEVDKQKIVHVELPLNASQRLMGSDMIDAFGQSVVAGNQCQISLQPDSKEEADRLFEALSNEGEIEVPIADQSWGDYYGSCVDRFGISWMINFEYEERGS